MSLISAVSARGSLRFMVHETGGVNAEVGFYQIPETVGERGEAADFSNRGSWRGASREFGADPAAAGKKEAA